MAAPLVRWLAVLCLVPGLFPLPARGDWEPRSSSSSSSSSSSNWKPALPSPAPATTTSTSSDSLLFQLEPSTMNPILGDPIVEWLPRPWSRLAPLPVSDYGSDPLEAYGGVVHAYNHNHNNSQSPFSMVSELALGGQVAWMPLEVAEISTESDEQRSAVTLAFSIQAQLDPLLGGYFGSGGGRWSGWAVGKLQVHVAGTFEVLALGVHSLYVDSNATRILGDPYRLGLARVPISLSQGEHLVFVPVGGLSPDVSIQLKVRYVPPAVRLYDIPQDLLVPDAVDGHLSSPYLSITIVNASPNNTTLTALRAKVQARMSTDPPLIFDLPVLAPAQMLPLSLRAPLHVNYCGSEASVAQDQLSVSVETYAGQVLLQKQLSVRCRVWGEPYRFTFLDFDQSVQKAAAYPPKNPCTAFSDHRGCPVLLTTHGASVEGDSDAWVYAYRQQPYAWILFPTNRRPYGYDWEGPGLLNGLRALEYLQEQLPGVSVERKLLYKVDASRRLYAGHSMGGHGCLVHSTLQPDYALAAACASGWIRRDLYVPSVYFTNGMSRIDKVRAGMIEASLDAYAVDVHLRNMAGVPALMRMGSKDDVVPAWGMRRVARMLNELNGSPNWTVISEIPNGGHWFDGIVNDDTIQAFFDKYLLPNSPVRPTLPAQFTITSSHPSVFEGRGGIKILQLQVPSRIGSIVVRRYRKGGNTERWVFRTSNVKRLGFVRISGLPVPTAGIRIDGMNFAGPIPYQPDASLCLAEGAKRWKICSDSEWTWSDRSAATHGPARQVFEQAPITIVYSTFTPMYLQEAQWIAQTLYYQGRYAVTMLPDVEFRPETMNGTQNLVILGAPERNRAAAFIHAQTPANKLVRFETVQGRRTFSLTSANNQERTIFGSATHGIVYLTPWKNAPVGGSESGGGLALISAGNSLAAFQAATCKLIPLHSSWKMGDFAVVDSGKVGWQGLGGLVALGYWSNAWQWDERTGFVDRALLNQIVVAGEEKEKEEGLLV